MRRLVIYDTETEYTKRLTGLLSGDARIPFEVLGFTRKDALCSCLSAGRADVLLIGEKDYEAGLPCDRAGLTLILREGNALPAPDIPSVEKYQPVSELMRSIFTLCAPENPSSGAVPGKKGRIIGIYSPVGRCGKTLFSLTLGMLLAESRPTVWLTFEEFSPYSKWLGTSSGRTLSDILYREMQDGTLSLSEIEAAAEDLRSLHCIPPVRVAQDIREASRTSVHRILHVLQDSSPYENIILDMGYGVSGLTGLLAECAVVYAPVRKDSFSEEKMRQFLTSVPAESSLLSRIRAIRLPAQEAVRDLYSLPLTTLGTFTRAQIRADSLL